MKSTLLNFTLISLTIAACGGQKPTVSVEQLSSTEASIEANTETTEAQETDLNFEDNFVDVMPSKIIGTNDFVKVKADGSNIEAGLRKYLDAFGLVQMGQRGLCSATHIGNGYVLSAGHCFLDTSIRTPQVAKSKSCSDVKIYFGYRGSISTGSAKPVVSKISNCTEIVYAELSTSSDFAILKIDSAPKVSIAISTDSKRTAEGTKLTIFGYPQGRPLEWSQFCALKTNRAITDFSSKKGESTFTHSCDTEGGNSGSSILSVTTQGTVKVIGIHDGLIPGNDLNYGTYLFDARQTLKKNGFDLDKAVAARNTLSF